MSCKKIVVFCLDSINNAGDAMLGDTTAYLVRRSFPDALIVRAQLDAPREFHLRRMFWGLIARAILITGYDKTSNGKSVLIKIFEMRQCAYYKKIMNGASHVIFAVGSFNYKQGGFDRFFDLITKTADGLDIPVMISAVHVSERDENDERWVRFRMAVNRKCVKLITTRDGTTGVIYFNNFWRENGNKCSLDFVGDPALWAPETYKATKKIGISLIRHGLLSEYGNSYSDEFAINLYIELIKEIERRGYRWQLFSNGMHQDNVFGQEIIHRIGGRWSDVAIVTSGGGLAKLIDGYDAIIAGRMHAMLTAVAMRVPFVGFAWDSKIDYVFQSLGYGANIVTMKELSVSSLMNKLDRVLPQRGRESLVDGLREKTAASIRDFVLSY